MSEPLITVIVTVYNTEKFLDKSLKSIVNQTYKNLNIIIVDDGSTDGSGNICEKWAKSDSRIDLIHLEKNQGPSVARNEAIKHIKGEYVLIVDSDDWMEEDMIEYLYKESDGAEVSICGFYDGCRDENKKVTVPKKLIMDSKTAFQMLLNDKTLRNQTWNKLVKRNLVENEMFPVGKKLADIMVSYKFMINSKKIVFLPEIKYHYRYNANGISRKPKISGALDALEMIETRYENTKNLYPDLTKEHYKMFSRFFTFFYGEYGKSNKEGRDNNKNRIDELVFKFIENNYSDLIKPYAPLWKKIVFKYNIETKWLPPLGMMLYTLDVIENAIKRKFE